MTATLVQAPDDNPDGPLFMPSAWEPEWMQESETDVMAAHFRDLLGEPSYHQPLDDEDLT